MPKLQTTDKEKLNVIEPLTIEQLITELERTDSNEFKKVTLHVYLKEFAAVNQLKFSDFMKVLRKLLSGLNDGPGVAEMMEILGKRVTIQRLRNIQSLLGGAGQLVKKQRNN